jgi:hypothetical protein
MKGVGDALPLELPLALAGRLGQKQSAASPAIKTFFNMTRPTPYKKPKLH